MSPVINPRKVNCRCGCLGVQEFHEAGERIRRYAFIDRPAELASKTVVKGKLTNGAGFGVPRNRKPAEVVA